jgi:hypothetical protein
MYLKLAYFARALSYLTHSCSYCIIRLDCKVTCIIYDLDIVWLGIIYATDRRHKLFSFKLEHKYIACLVITAMSIIVTIENV